MEPLIAVVVPTIREECLQAFLAAWKFLFDLHRVELIVVKDGDEPALDHYTYHRENDKKGPHFVDCCNDPRMLLKENADLIFNRTDAVRNFGFAYIALNLPTVEYIITFDDDVAPIPDTDPIEEHKAILSQRAPLSWMSSTAFGGMYMRGMPYVVRNEAPIMLSHGVWHGVPDLDAPTQLLNPELKNYYGPFYRGVVPSGAYFPVCGMNVAFRRKALKYAYWAPMGPRAFGLGRWADIFMGVKLKEYFDSARWAIFTGGAPVRHTRASNVWKNLAAESTVLELNESFWQGDESKHPQYFELYRTCRDRWQQFIEGTEKKK